MSDATTTITATTNQTSSAAVSASATPPAVAAVVTQTSPASGTVDTSSTTPGGDAKKPWNFKDHIPELVMGGIGLIMAMFGGGGLMPIIGLLLAGIAGFSATQEGGIGGLIDNLMGKTKDNTESPTAGENTRAQQAVLNRGQQTTAQTAAQTTAQERARQQVDAQRERAEEQKKNTIIDARTNGFIVGRDGKFGTLAEGSLQVVGNYVAGKDASGKDASHYIVTGYAVAGRDGAFPKDKNGNIVFTPMPHSPSGFIPTHDGKIDLQNEDVKIALGNIRDVATRTRDRADLELFNKDSSSHFQNIQRGSGNQQGFLSFDFRHLENGQVVTDKIIAREINIEGKPALSIIRVGEIFATTLPSIKGVEVEKDGTLDASTGWGNGHDRLSRELSAIVDDVKATPVTPANVSSVLPSTPPPTPQTQRSGPPNR